MARSHILPSAITAEKDRGMNNTVHRLIILILRKFLVFSLIFLDIVAHISDVPPALASRVAHSGLKIFGYVILVIIIGIILVFGGIFLYQYKKEDRRKRFY